MYNLRKLFEKFMPFPCIELIFYNIIDLQLIIHNLYYIQNHELQNA